MPLLFTNLPLPVLWISQWLTIYKNCFLCWICLRNQIYLIVQLHVSDILSYHNIWNISNRKNNILWELYWTYSWGHLKTHLTYVFFRFLVKQHFWQRQRFILANPNLKLWFLHVSRLSRSLTFLVQSSNGYCT